MVNSIIKVENLSKRYILTHHANRGSNSRYTALRDVVAEKIQNVSKGILNGIKGNGLDGLKSKKEDFWALNDVNFEVKQGDRIGIIGRNGAGKSTLLKVLSRITDPTKGRISIDGRVASLLEVGTGFHPELTGRENIFLNGAILGMSKSEIKRKFDEIVSFADIEKFLDTPVKRYSSGMYVRLAFAVAAHLESEILIIDEVLAVGDSEFQKKCLGKMEEVSKSQDRTILFVSHNMAAVSTLCNRGIILQKGSISTDTSIRECITTYQIQTQQQFRTKELATIPRIGNSTGEAIVTGFSIRNVDSFNEIIDADKPCVAELVFEVLTDSLNVSCEFTITDGIQKLFLFHSYLKNGLVPVFKKGIHKFICNIAPLLLYSGTYYITLGLSRPGVPIDYIENAASVEIELFPRDGCMYDFKKVSGSCNFYVEHNWEIKE